MLKELLSDTGTISCMRFMAVLSLLIGAGIALVGLMIGKDLVGLSALCGVFVAPAFAAKCFQKQFECGNEKP